MEQPVKKSYEVKKKISTVITVLILAGLAITFFNRLTHPSVIRDMNPLVFLVGYGVTAIAAVVFHIIVHESGHLVFGLVGGYKFNSFRVFNIAFIKTDEGIKVKKHSVAGTAGQCLMSSPDEDKGKICAFLYNMGGVIFNLVFAAIFYLLDMLTSEIPAISTVMFIFWLYGAYTALTNGIPLCLNLVNNDGYNLYEIIIDPFAQKGLKLELDISTELSKGIKIEDMPSEWFVFPKPEEMKTSIGASVGVYVCNRLMCEGKYEEAKARLDEMIWSDTGMVGLHRYLLTCDRIYLELIGSSIPTVVNSLLTDKQKKMMKAMKSNPSVIRTEYTYALLYERDLEKANKLLDAFAKAAKKYPYPQEMMAEQRFIGMAQQKMEQIQQAQQLQIQNNSQNYYRYY